MGIFNFFTQDLAIDLGTANTLIMHKDKLVVDEPSIIAVNRASKEVLAIGSEAQKMHGKTHEDIKTVRPLKDGVIADFEAAEQMISGFIKMINTKGAFGSPQLRMVICIPSGITQVEKRAVKESAERSGGKEVYMIPEPMAAAIGIGVDVAEPMGNMIIDIGERTAENIKVQVGAALPELETPPEDYPVNGRDLMTGIPKQIMVSYTEIALALDKSISKIEEAVMKALELTPPELSADIYQTGLYLTGGGALLRGLDRRISSKTKLPVYVAEDPLRAVVRGTSVALKNLKSYRTIFT
jgi:rod shape-determining protein MreB